MKIVMICDFYNEKLEYQENLLTKYYTKHGHEVVVITSTFESVFDYYENKQNKNAPKRVYFDNGAKIIKLPYVFNFLNKIRKYTSIKTILVEEKPDLIYVHDILPNILEARDYIIENPQCQMIMDYHSDYSNSANGWLSLNILHKILRKKLYLDPTIKHLKKIFPIVPASTRFLNEVYGVELAQMELLPLGADTDFGESIQKNNEGLKIRESLNIPKTDIVIFSGGKLQPAKKTELLIEAYLHFNRTDLHLIIIGEAGLRDEEYKKKLICLANNHPRIYFIGWLTSSDVYKYLDASDLAVFPASQSILWQQAISMGLPLIAGDIGDQSIEYLNEDNNIIVLMKDQITSEEILKNIQRIINDKNILLSMKNGARKATEKHLNWNNLIWRTLQFNK